MIVTATYYKQSTLSNDTNVDAILIKVTCCVPSTFDKKSRL